MKFSEMTFTIKIVITHLLVFSGFLMGYIYGWNRHEIISGIIFWLAMIILTLLIGEDNEK
jgi:hypothetical protein